MIGVFSGELIKQGSGLQRLKACTPSSPRYVISNYLSLWFLLAPKQAMSTSSQLCSLCQGISVRALCVSENDEGEETNPYGYQHQPCYNALVQSAKTCVLCLLILSELEKARESGLYFPTCDKDNADSMISLLSIKRCIEELDSPKGLTSIKIQWGKHALPLAQVSLVTHPSKCYLPARRK